MHPVTLVSTSSLEMTGCSIAKLRYDSLIVLLLAMQAELKSQAAKDHVSDRPELSLLGKQTVHDVGTVIDDLRTLLKLSRPYLADEFKDVPCLVID